MKKKALITGSSRGIGRAVALRLAQDGFDVLIHYAGNKESALETKAQIEKTGGTAQLIQADLCALEQTIKIGEVAASADVLVLNASVQIRKKWQEITVEECNTQINCNFISSMLLIQASVPNMQKKEWGRIVTIGSVQEKKPHPDMLIYSASKAAQTNMVQSMALQLAPFGITVNNVAPGVISTDRNVQALADPIYNQKVVESIPLGYIAQPEDCAGIVSLLCSDDGRYITGQNIFVDGGKGIQ